VLNAGSTKGLDYDITTLPVASSPKFCSRTGEPMLATIPKRTSASSAAAANNSQHSTGTRRKRKHAPVDAGLVELLNDCRRASESSAFHLCSEIAPGLWDDHGQLSWNRRIFFGAHDPDFAATVAAFFLAYFWRRPLRANRGGAAA
jgi:hypothetical protein